MKKLFFILLLVTYGFSSSGITLQFHFCCGKLKNIAWSQSFQHNCGNKSMGDKPCCETKSFTIEEGSEYDKTSEIPVPVKCKTEIINSWKNPVDSRQPLNDESLVAFHPPNSNNTPLFILNRVFRI